MDSGECQFLDFLDITPAELTNCTVRLKMKTLAIITLLCIPLSVFGGDFDNWYFEFLTQRCELAGKIFSSDDKQTGTFTGTSSGKASPSGTKFTESFEYVFLPGAAKAKDALVWTKGKDAVFRSSGTDTVGNEFSSELTVKADKTYKLKSTFADGRTIVTEARLKADDVIHAIDTARTKKGDVVFVLKYKRSKAKQQPYKPTGEQGGGVQPATRTEQK